MSMQEILDRAGVPYRTAGQHHHCRPGWLQTDCPQCGITGHYRLGFSLNRRTFNCWACGPVNRVDALAQLLNVPKTEAFKLLADLPAAVVEEEKVGGRLTLPPDCGPLQRPHKAYLRGRGFDPNRLEQEFGLRGVGPLGGPLAWGVLIPVVYRGEVVSWTTRTISVKKDGGPRYRSARRDQEKVHHKHLLFGADLCGGSCVVTEGPFDAMRVGPGAVATFGTTVTPEQLLLISKFDRRAIWFDDDFAGRAKARRLAEALAPFAGETFVITSAGKDPDTARPADLEAVRCQFLPPSRPHDERSAGGGGLTRPPADRPARATT